ncbi:hypothetical protein [Amycolatopsis rubida]|uniref:Uncharacterized protein n=1 Tax=Amycolatopsis rubida TaxID=112413 RepID=A0A1I5XE49_9PSEU|nr:hypothetical protein [Amycolatopsis rubida]SFQ30228.1 hypothetical protein SAMN05421854_110178 [Amycolatopsis rubida]
MPTADGRLTAQDRAQITGELTRIRHLITGTVLPALERFPDDAQHRHMLAEAERLAEALEQLVLRDEQRVAREGPVDEDS